MGRRTIQKKDTVQHTCYICEKTDYEFGYDCDFCMGKWHHYSCSCQCTECARPGYPGMCPICRESFDNEEV